MIRARIRFSRLLAALLLTLSLLATPSARADSHPPAFLSTAPIPDFTQSDPATGLPNGGRQLCAPAAISNSLMALFADEFQQEGMTQAELVKLLASEGYMHTHPEKGTWPNQVLRAVQRFVRNRGVNNFYLEFQGLRDHERQFGRGHRNPSLRWIQSNIANGSGVWLNIGWYKLDRETGTFTRDDGHWVTAVGYGQDRQGNTDPSILIVHNPVVATPNRRSYIRIVPLPGGRIEGASKNYTFAAKGVYQVSRGIVPKTGTDCALLDGAAALNISRPR